MKFAYKFIPLFFIIFHYTHTYAAPGTLTIDPKEEKYTLPKLWYFMPEDNMKYRDVRDFPDNAVFLPPTESWTQKKEFKDYFGNAWFGLKIIAKNVHSDYALFLHVQSRGTQVYWNGKLLYETRHFDVRGNTPEILGKPSFISIPENLIIKGENSLTLRVGFLNNRGRVTYPILFGQYKTIQNSWVIFNIWNAFLWAVNTFIFIYFIIIYNKRRNEKFYLYLSLFSFFIGLWIFGYRGFVFFIFNNQIIYTIFTYVGAMSSALMYINFLLHFLAIKETIPLKVLKSLYATLIIFLIIELTITGNIFYFHKYYLYNFFMLLNAIWALGAFYYCIIAVKNHKPYAKRIFLGTSIYIISFLLSVPFFLDIIIVEPLVVEGFSAMIVFFASVLASRFAQVHTDLEKSFKTLQQVGNEKDRAMESLNIYKHIVSASRDLMAFINTERKLAEANDTFLNAYDKSRSEVINKKIDAIFGKEEYDKSLKEHINACFSGETVVFERWHRFPGIGARYMLTTLYPYLGVKESQEGIVYYSMDITERVKLEQEMVAVSENERAAIGIELHDNLAQKLFGIALKASVLSSDIADRFPEQGGAAREIEDLVNKAVAYTRTIAKSMTRMDSEEGGFAAVVTELKRLLENRYNITLDLNINGDISFENRLYYSQIYYIIQEAVTNSVKHSNAETISVSLRRNSGDIKLLVRDDGIGIPDRIGPDKGIGLKIMKYRARMIGSSISIKRGRGGGTEVTCVIPVQ